MSDPALDAVRPLLRTRQVREFRPDPVPDAVMHAVTEAARWSGSSTNTQPWRFLVIRDVAAIRALHDAGLPQTRALATAPALVAIVMPSEDGKAVSHAFDEGRAAERMLVAATMTGVAGGILWVRNDIRARAAEILGIPAGWYVRTIVALGLPSDAARTPKSAPGKARRPREQTVFDGRWPAG